MPFSVCVRARPTYYYKANVEFFDDLGSPGGASKMGLIEKDHPIVTALPLRTE